MPNQLLSVSRAARLAGMSRAALQKEIHHGKLATFEGKVLLTDLLRMHPEAQVEDDTMLEKVEWIKAHAKPSRNRDKEYIPVPEVLKTRLTALSRDLIASRNQLKHANQTLTELRERLAQLETIPSSDWPAELMQTRQWLDTESQACAALPEPQANLLVKDTFLRIMSAHVKLIPSGHDFFLEGSESILDAALRAGLSINYGCASGNCGNCKARVVSGETWPIRASEHQLSATEQHMGYVLMCSTTAVTDLVLEAQEAMSEQDLPQQEIAAQVIKQTRLGNGLLVLDVQTPKESSLRFMAGQCVELQLGENGPKNSYPLASCPCDGQHLQFHMRNHGHDALAQQLFATNLENHAITVRGPYGHFVAREGEVMILVAQNEGFAPMKSLIEHAIATDMLESLRLYWAVDEIGHYMNNLCRSWADALEYFHYQPLNSGDAAVLAGQCLADCHASNTDWPRAWVYLAGDAAFLAAMRPAFVRAGAQETQIATLQIGG